jgi:hypothetical protein
MILINQGKKKSSKTLSAHAKVAIYDRIFVRNPKYFIMNIAKMLTVRTTSSR